MGRTSSRGLLWIFVALLPAAPVRAAEVVLPPAPDEIVRRMASLLAATKGFSFHAEITFDTHASWGELVELGGTVDVSVARPDRAFFDYLDDASARRLWLDGTNVTLLDPVDGFYAVRPQPGDIDATVDALRERLALRLPLGELIANDPSELLELTRGKGRYVGSHEVDGAACDHLAFALPEVDLQLWVQAEGEPLLRRLVIVFREEAGLPRYEATLGDWKLGPQPSPAVFQAALPEGAAKIEFLEARGGVR